jgi:hypothetical protein
MREMPWGITVLPGLEVGAPVSLGREAKAEALAVMGTACPVYESGQLCSRVEPDAVADGPRAGVRRMKYMVRAVSRDIDGKVTDVANTWPLNASSVEEAKAEVDRQHWREPGDVANAFEITDESGNALTWRSFRTGGKPASWS